MGRVVLLIFCALLAITAGADPARRVLLVTGQDYPGHKWQETAPVLAEGIRADARLEVVVTEEPKDLASPLDAYDAIVLHFMNWEQPDPGEKARENLKKFVEGGKGLVLVHFACGAFQEWPEFRNLAGRSYDPSLRGHDPFGTFRVDITSEKHPITEGLEPFETTDELYTCLAGDRPVNVLATARSAVDGKDYPMAFVHDYGQGRVFHSVLGHDAPSLENGPVAELFRRATAWAAGLPAVEARAEIPAGRPVLLVLNKHEDTMSFVDPETLKPFAKVATGPNPHEIVVSNDQRFAYLSNYAPPGNTISVIDLVKRRHVQQIDTGEYSRIHGAAIAPDGRRAWFTAGQTGFLVEVDTQTNEVTRAIPTHGKISHMVVVSPDGKRLYTANIASENVSVLDAASGELIAQILCGSGCEGMAFTPDGKHLWVGNQTGGSISIIDVTANEVVETFECPGMPVRIKFTADGRLALVPSWTEQGELVVIDAASRKELKRIAVGSQAIGVEISPDGKRAFVGCEKTDGVHVIDMAALLVTDVVHTGNGSDAMAWWVPPAKE